MWIDYNANPEGKRVGDCVVRALSKFTGETWDDVYIDLCINGFVMGDILPSNAVWGAWLRENGYKRTALPDTCPDCYTIREFCEDHPHGRYLVATGTHVVAVEDGDYYDTWDSGDETPVNYWQ